MTITSPRVSFGLYDLSIKPDSTPSVTDVQTFSKILDLKTDNVNPQPYVTYEPNFWLLDGGYKFLPSNTNLIHVGWMTLSQSNGSGVFTTAPVLTVTFGSVHLIDGLVLRFSQYTGDWANSINVKLYDAADAQISSTNYTPSSWEWSTTFTEVAVKKIVITFNSTNKATRYLRLTGIEYGELVYFEGADIRECSVVEQISMIGTEAPVDTLHLLLHSTDADFSMLNPAGNYTALQNRQPLTVYEVIDGSQITIGQFYLDSWRNKSDTEIEFEASDLLSILDTMYYNGGLYSGVTVQAFVDTLLTGINIPYDLDYDLTSVTLTGWIPYCTYREALQQIAFAAGGFLTCSRSSLLRIVKSKIASQATAWDTEITTSQKGDPQSLELMTLVTGVDITSHNYVSGSGTVTIFSGTLPVGQHQIIFDQPMYNVTGSGYNWLAAGVNDAVVNVITEGTVTLTGTAYVDAKKIYSVRATIGAYDKQNVIKITDATLVSSANGQAVADRVYAYFSQRYKQIVRLYAPLAEPGNIALIDTLYGRKLIAGIEKMELDLSGGFIADIEAIGVENGLG